MALTLYPDQNTDSFITVAQADTIIATYTLDSVKWLTLPTDQREVLLRIAYAYIIDNTDPTMYPDPMVACVGEAQALMASHDNVNSLSGGQTSTATKGALKKQKVGVIERQFYDVAGKSTRGTVSRVPDMAKSCLESLGFAVPSTGQTHLGRM